MSYDTINDDLILEFPELSILFEEQFISWAGNDIPSHCFFGDSLNSYVTELLRRNNDREQIEKVFRFYERLACSDDEKVKDLLQVTLLEYLWDEKTVYENALCYMLPETYKMNSAIGSYLRIPRG